jgi:quinol-cytochrome oxidoreductase complex cytochrome b subunit
MMSFFDRLRNSRLWQSIVRHPAPVDKQGRALTMLGNLVLHLHPVSISEHALRPSFTWCMGGITFFLFLVETLTGVLLMFYYRPTIQWAYHDMLDLRDVVSFGVVREIHRWGAHAMVITVMLHMYRVFLTGSYKRPREFNWCVGVLLLVLVLLFSFTGYLLPWDQLSLWAVTVGANLAGDARWLLLGARTVGEETLNRFYVLHCVGLPLAAVSLMAVHFWRVRKDGISGPL